MFEKMMMILGFCLLMFQSSLSMENDKIQEMTPIKSITSEDSIDVNSAKQKFEQEQGGVDRYKIIVEENSEKTVILIEKASRLGTEADRLTNEAIILAREARTSRGKILIIEQAYKEAERAYKKAAKAHRIASKAELATAKVDLASADAEKALSELPSILNIESLKMEHRIKEQRHRDLWEISINNAEAALNFERMLLFDADMLRFEREKKVLSAQETSLGLGKELRKT